MIQQAAMPNENVLEAIVVPTGSAGVVNLNRRRRPRQDDDDGDGESADNSIPHQRTSTRTLYDILHYVVWNGYGREVGKAIGASKVLDTAEMYQSKYGLAQIVYRVHSYYPRTRLMFAAMKGNMARTRLLLANRADVHVDDEKALKLAISNAHADVARLLIEHGADVCDAFSGWPQCEKGVDVASYRALIRELMNAHPTTVSSGDVLVIAIKDSDAALVSQTVNEGFIAWGDDGAGVVLYNGLLSDYIEQETGPEIAATARALYSHPFFTFRETIMMAGHVASNNEEGIAWVRELSVSPEAAAHADELLWAGSCAGLVDVVFECLYRDGDPNFHDLDWGPDCAIMMAARGGWDGVVVMLAQREDIDVNWALVAAACIGSLDLCTELINRGADAGWVSGESSESAFQFSINKNNFEILRLLLQHESARQLAREDPSLWRSAMQAGTNANALVRTLLENRILPKIEDLCYAAEAGKRHMVRDILAARVEGVNARSLVRPETVDDWQFSLTPLLSACYGLQRMRHVTKHASESDFLSLVRLLCEAGANLEARIGVTSPRVVRDGYGGGFTPLLLAAYAGSAAVVDELIKHGADINGRCANGQTALYYAREQGHDIIAQALIARGATVPRNTLMISHRGLLRMCR